MPDFRAGRTNCRMSRGSHEPLAISCHNIYGDSVDSRDIGKIVATVCDPTRAECHRPLRNGLVMAVMVSVKQLIQESLDRVCLLVLLGHNTDSGPEI